MAENQTVDSTVQVGGSNITTQGFGIILILAAHSAFSERYREYSGSEDVQNDFSTDSPVYRAVKRAEQQTPSPDTIAIGRRDDTGAVAQVDTGTIDDAALADSDVFTVTFEGRSIEVQYEQGGSSPDADEAAQQIVDAVNGEQWPITAATTATLGEFTLTSDFIEVPFDGNVTGTISSYSTTTAHSSPDESVPNALSAIEDVYPDWFGLITVDRSDTAITDASTWVEGKAKKYLARSNASDILSSGTSDVFATLQGLSHQDSGGFFHTRPWYFPDVALMADRLGTSPDDQMSTWEKVELVGVPTESGDDLSTTEQGYLDDKNATYYLKEAGVGSTQGGKVFVGEWWDVMIGIDWFNARLEERTFKMIHGKVNADSKVPYTQTGVTEIEGVLLGLFEDAFDSEFLAENPAPEVDAPQVNEVPDQDRSNRELPPISWNARLAGAIHFAEFTGTVEA